MRVLKEEKWALVRTVTAICITAMALICLVLAAGCTNDLTEITENRGTGETLALGTLTTKDANAAHAATRADSPLPDATAWQGFCSGDQLHVAIAAGEGSTFTRSSGIYEYTAAGNIPGSGSWTASTPAYWQRANGNILTLWRGPDCDTATPGAYDMPLTYETDVIQGHALNAWDGNTYTNDADKWRIMDLLRYCSADADLPTAATGMPATGSPLNLILKHSMAQLCVELLPGEGMTAQELQAQVTVHLKSAAATFTIQTDGRPAIYNFENEQNRQDVRLLKNGATSLKFYALMLPGQTFGTNRAMMSLHIGDTHFTYTPGTPLTTTENTCHKLVLQVNRTEVSALSVTSTGWQDPTVITQPDEAEAEGILVINETPGTLKDNATLLNALKDATQESPVGLIITGKINDKDLEDLSSLMKYKDGDTNKFKVSSLAIYATGGTTLPHYFASNNPNPNPALKKIILPEGITDTGEISFYNCTALTDVTLPDGLTIINRNAFRSCNALKSIKLPETVTDIKNLAFRSCTALENINIPEKVTKIGEQAFYDCQKLKITKLPDNLESIEKQAFYGCIALESINIPDKTKDIGEQAFLVCSGLTSLTIGDGMINIGKKAFLYTSLQSVTIQSAQAIGESAFFGCSSLSDVIIGHVKNIGESAFSGCTNLSSLNIEGTESIGDQAFKNCTSLASITLPQTITGIGTFAFAGSGLTSITIPRSVKQISDEAFNGCTALKTATLEEGVETIGKNAFTNCKELTDITIPSTVTSIGNYAFNICPKLATVTFAGETPQLNSLGQNAFQSCEALTSIDIPDNVTTLATRTFNLCTTLENVTLPNQLESIGDFVFNECSALKKLDIPQSVTSIGGNAFNRCGELTTVNFLGQVPQLNSIGRHAFYECQKLADLTLPDRLTSIGESAFYRCNALTSIRIPDNVVTIATKVFQECSGLVTVVLPKNLENIKDLAFNNCSALANFVYAGSALPAPTVSRNAYSVSSRLKYLFLPNYTSTITGTSLIWAGKTWKNIHYNANSGTDMSAIDALTNINNYQNHITQ
ncbi:leucine-rich repeat protein [Bacteroides eggerthii]|uniref:Bacterial surface protein n=1 Tax=Bacteroides eggerthii TaxID=28111 RepID=A0A380YSX8_9BACE|nr:leucine-rich repeat protein [Bacteroides eggerthii]QRQ47291.1 leucine-rich repeat protein [Bacteroides eggerthii]UWN87163.1 leucine-rich repeat protein [Bacteroides eggerthii]SUV29582.1 bacterial surface protein [Bacteroides eggerthii]